MKTANCPGCGAAIEFKIGSSVVLVCPYCRAAVARTDRDVENLGKVSDLIDTASPLKLGLAGRYQGTAFRVAGRLQYRHDSGSFWDEWYAAFDDGRWGWVDEADGNYYITFETQDRDAPRAKGLQLGQQVPTVDSMKVFEIGVAELVSGEGELPHRFSMHSTYTYADLSGAGGRFATIEDLGVQPAVFKGRETSLAELGIALEADRSDRFAVKKLTCTKCGGSFNLVAPDKAERVACPHCGALHDVKPGSVLAFLQMQKKRSIEPVIPLGSEGSIDGVKYIVTGFMQRTVTDGETFSWDEYLLFNREMGFRYLTCDENHWSFEQPVLSGDIDDSVPLGAPPVLYWKKKPFTLFETSSPKVTFVLGEFPWKVDLNEKVQTADFIAPPEGMSKEFYSTARGNEVNYSVARYMTAAEVEAAFGITYISRPFGVGAMQPNPYPELSGAWGSAMVALAVIGMMVSMTMSRGSVYKDTFDLARMPTVSGTTAPTPIRQFSTKPFRLAGNRHIRIRSTSNVGTGDHVELAGDFDAENGDVFEAVDLWSEYSSGSDDEGPWTEDEREDFANIAALPGGEYTIHFQAQYNSAVPPVVEIEINEGAFRCLHFILAAVAISIVPAFARLRRKGFETQRWSESDYGATSGSTSSDDDDDED